MSQLQAQLEPLSEVQSLLRRSAVKIYFAQAGENGPIKIGFSQSPAERLATIQLDQPYKVQLLAQMLGPKKLEKELHQRFAHLKTPTNNEWFFPEPELLDFIKTIPPYHDDKERWYHPNNLLEPAVVRKLMKKQGLTHESVCKEIGLSEDQWYQFLKESGYGCTDRWFSLTQVRKLGKFLGIRFATRYGTSGDELIGLVELNAQNLQELAQARKENLWLKLQTMFPDTAIGLNLNTNEVLMATLDIPEEQLAQGIYLPQLVYQPLSWAMAKRLAQTFKAIFY